MALAGLTMTTTDAAAMTQYTLLRLSGARPESPLATMQALLRARADALSGRAYGEVDLMSTSF
jgi:hypothetical protein